jgi:hypothetical protein
MFKSADAALVLLVAARMLSAASPETPLFQAIHKADTSALKRLLD